MARSLLAPGFLVALLLARSSSGASFPGDPAVEPPPSIPSAEEVFCSRAEVYLERFRKDDLAQAIRLFRQVIKNIPNDPRGEAGLAEARAIQYLQGWDPNPDTLKKGLDAATEAAGTAPDSAPGRLGLELALMASERYTPALSELDRAVALAPGSARAHLYRAMVLRGMRRTQEALDETGLALKITPSWPVLSAMLGDGNQDLRRYKDAVACYLMAAQLDQGLLWARLGLAAAYQRQSNLPAAEQTYLLAEKSFPDDVSRIRILSASLLVAQQHYDDALTMYQAMAETEAVSPPLYRRLMLAGRAFSLEKLERLEESEYYWSKLVEEFPSGFDGGFRDREVAAQAFESLARNYEVKGDHHRALAILEKGCQNVGMGTGLYASLADRQLAAGRLDQALTTLSAGLKETLPDEDWVLTTQKFLPTLRSAAGPRVSQKVRKAGIDVVRGLAEQVRLSDPPSFVPYLNLARAEALFHATPEAVEHLGEAVKKGYGGLQLVSSDPDFKLLAQERAFKEMLGETPP